MTRHIAFAARTAASLGFLLATVSASAQPVPVPKPLVPKLLALERVSVVDMIPQTVSDETGQDSEPNVAVDPANPLRIVASAFTRNPTGATTSAPIFVSSDRGATWSLNNIVPSGSGATGDISIAMSQAGGRAYLGILRGGSGLRMMVLRTTDPFAMAIATVLVDRQGMGVDQPWVEAKSTPFGGSTVDRVFVGNNDFNAASGRTASVESSLDAAALLPTFTTSRIETRTTAGQDMPPTRVSAHDDGTVYGVFYRWASGTLPLGQCDVVVVRDDNWTSGTTRFGALTDIDGLAGRRVATGRTVPAFPANLGANRLVASNVSIAVDPRNSAVVWVAWADRVGTADYTLHVRRSTDRAVTWSGDLLTVTDATNPALAVNSSGTVGFLYQQLVGAAPSRSWETHFRRRTATGITWSDKILAHTPDNSPAPTFQPYIGDYADVVAVGAGFYGVFSAGNIPDQANFPSGVKFLRNADFTNHRLLGVDNVTPVGLSIDPFFFSVRPGSIIDLCARFPKLCVTPTLGKNLIKFDCKTLPCRVVDPIPNNCKVKWSCPGCGPGGLCPPWYHVYVEEMDPRVWKVGLYNKAGEEIPYLLEQVHGGVVLSFRPSARQFEPGRIGDYVLTFEADKVKKGSKFQFKTVLESSNGPRLTRLSGGP